MLIWLRERKRKVAKWFVYPLIVVFFALYGSAQIQQRVMLNKLTALKVNGARVSYTEYQAVSEEVGRYLSDTPVRPEKSHGELALDQLVQRELARQLAHDLNLRTDDAEVKRMINMQLTGGRGGTINEFAMKRFLQDAGFESPEDFKSYMRRQMDVRLAMNYVASTAVPSEEDVQRALKRQKDMRTIEMLFFNSEDAFPKVKAATEEVEAYFKQHIERYRFPRRMKIDYVEALPETYVAQATPEKENLLRWFNNNKEKFVVPVERDVAAITFLARDFRSRVTINEEELKAFYEKDPSKYQVPEKFRARFVSVPVEIPDASVEAVMAKNPEGYLSKTDAVGVRHLLLRTQPEASDTEKEEVRKKIEAIRARIKTLDDFIRETRENSDDTSNKLEGGDLGFFDKGKMVPEFEAAAFEIPDGTVSQPVQTSFGYHLLWKYSTRKAGEKVSVKEARPKAAAEIDQQAIRDMAKKKLSDITAALAGRSLAAATSITSLPVIETDWFARGDIPHEEASRDRYPFFQAVSQLAPGKVSDIVEGFYRYYLVELIDKQPARIKTLEEARSEVERNFRNQKATELARTQAMEAANRVRSGSLEFSAVPQAYGIPNPTTYTGLRNPQSGQQREENARVDREILSQAFTLTQDKIAGPVDTLQGPTLLKLAKETPEHLPEISEVEKQANDEYRKVVATELARDRIWTVWIDMEKHSDSLRAAAQTLGAEVKTSEFFEPGSPIPGFSNNSVVNYAAAGLRVAGATTSVLEDPPMNQQNPQPIHAYYLIQCATIEESRLPRFDEVKGDVRKDLQLERAAPIAMASAENALNDISSILKAATAPFSASRSIDLGSFARERHLKLVGPVTVRLDTIVQGLPGENSGGSVTATAYNLPLGGLSKVVPVLETAREGDALADRIHGYVVLQVVDIKPAGGGAATRGQAFRAIAQTLQANIQNDWSLRGRKMANIDANPEFVPKDVIEELTKEKNKS